MTLPVTRPTNALSVGLALSILLTLAPPADAIEVVEGLNINLQLRTRLNRNDGRDGVSGQPENLFFDNRARLTLDGRLEMGIRGLIQLQDARVWGEEDSTLFDAHAEGFDVHQAWAQIPLGLEGLSLRFGRQEINIDGQRLVGAVAWTAQARSFDAARLMYKNPNVVVSGELLFAMLSDRETLLPTTTNPEDVEKDTAGFAGAVVGLDLPKEGPFKHHLSAYSFLDWSDTKDRTRFTVGLYDKGSFDIFHYRVEGYFQGGQLAGQTISAFMFGAYAGVKFGETVPISIGGWADYISGTANPDEASLRTFDTLFGTNHKFYGHSDFFLNMPKHTGGKGLVDLALKTSIKPVSGLSIFLDFHHFRAAEPRDESPVYGWEADFKAAYKPWKYTKLFFGFYTFVPDDGLAFRLGGTDPDFGVYTFAQVDI